MSPVKLEVLESLLLHEKPVKAAEVAKELNMDSKVVQMHLIGLVRLGVAVSPSKGQYIVSEGGKTALGLPKVTRETALAILAQMPHDKAFHFYVDIGKPTQCYASDLLDFCNKISTVNHESVIFHFERGDFEAWFKMLGDVELAKKTSLLKRRKLSAAEVRSRLRDLAEARFKVLSEIAGKSTASM